MTNEEITKIGLDAYKNGSIDAIKMVCDHLMDFIPKYKEQLIKTFEEMKNDRQ